MNTGYLQDRKDTGILPFKKKIPKDSGILLFKERQKILNIGLTKDTGILTLKKKIPKHTGC